MARTLDEDAVERGGAEDDGGVRGQGHHDVAARGHHVDVDGQQGEGAAGHHRGDERVHQRVEVELAADAQGHLDQQAAGERAQDLGGDVQKRRGVQQGDLADEAGQQADDQGLSQLRTGQDDGQAVHRDDEVRLHAHRREQRAHRQLEHRARGQQHGDEDEVLRGQARPARRRRHFALARR